MSRFVIVQCSREWCTVPHVRERVLCASKRIGKRATLAQAKAHGEYIASTCLRSRRRTEVQRSEASELRQFHHGRQRSGALTVRVVFEDAYVVHRNHGALSARFQAALDLPGCHRGIHFHYLVAIYFCLAGERLEDMGRYRSRCCVEL